MNVDRQILRELAAWDEALDPSASWDRPQDDECKLYVPFDPWVDPDGSKHHLRGQDDVVTELTQQIRMASFKRDPLSTQLLAGFRGTGKTTELKRLAARLAEREFAPDFAVVAFDVSAFLALNGAPTPELIGLALAAGLTEYAATHWNVVPFESRGTWARMRDFLLQDVEDINVTLPAAGMDVRVVLRETPDLADDLKRLLAHKPQRLPDFVHTVVGEVVRKMAPRQVVLLVDGLDKFLVPREQVLGVYRAMADLFFQHVQLLRLPRCHVVYVIPPYLGFLNKGLAEAYGGRLRVLPSVKVRERRSKGGGKNQAAIRCLEQVAARRVDLERLFGASRREALDALALASGGHVRDLFNLLREVLRRAMSVGLPVSLSDVQDAIQAVSQDRGGLFRSTLELLETIDASEDLAALREEQLSALSGAMDEYLVLSYRNGDSWYGVHPLIEPLLGQGLAALKRLGAAEGSPSP